MQYKLLLLTGTMAVFLILFICFNEFQLISLNQTSSHLAEFFPHSMGCCCPVCFG